MKIERPWVYFPMLNICFAFVPKVANTAMKVAFAEMFSIGDVDRETGRGVHRIPALKGQAPESIAHFNCPKILFVRNPFDRLVSFYKSKIIGDQPWQNMKHLPFYKYMPFEEFVDIVCETPDCRADHHFRSQTYDMDALGRKLDDLVLYRYELINQHWGRLKALYIPDLPDLKLVNVSSGGVIFQDYKKYYNTHTREKIAVRYRRDLIELDYCG